MIERKINAKLTPLAYAGDSADKINGRGANDAFNGDFLERIAA